MYEEKLKQYDTERKRIEDKLRNVEKVDKDFYMTAEYIIQLAKHSSALFRYSEYKERRLLINTALLNVKWNGVTLYYDYKEPFNLLAEMNQSTVRGTLVDVFRTKLLDLEKASLINSIKQIFHANYRETNYYKL